MGRYSRGFWPVVGPSLECSPRCHGGPRRTRTPFMLNGRRREDHEKLQRHSLSVTPGVSASLVSRSAAIQRGRGAMGVRTPAYSPTSSPPVDVMFKTRSVEGLYIGRRH